MDKKELLETPFRDWEQTLERVVSVYVLPSERKHESGWACMDFVAEFEDGSKTRFGCCCDDVSFKGEHFRMDCLYPSGIIRIWNLNCFSISPDLSSIDFTENI